MKQKKTIQTFIFFVIICCCILEFSCTRHSAETGFAGISKEEIETRVEKLLEQMTLDEKIELVGGQGMGSKPNSRLGIPWIRMTDGPLGPGARGKATNYSACINMASTWDKALVERVGEAIGKETRGIGCDMILAPCINIARVPHGGRTFEGFGEDPYMVTRLTEAYINGVQRQRVSVCVKHFACNNQEWNRGEVSAEVDERTLREIYLPAFKAAVQESHAWSIMAAYNLVNGTECCENEYLLTDILKNEWGFDGVVVSDWGGVCSTVKTAKSGLDLEMPDGKYMGENLLKAVKNGQVEESVIDDKVRRILRLCFRLGLFNEETTTDSTAVNTSEHRKLALEVAQKSIVLLKNESHFLPLNKENLKSISVIGPNAYIAQMSGGGSGSLNGFYEISPLEGIQKKVGDQVDIQFARGVSHKRLTLPAIKNEALIPLNAKKDQHGLKAEYFNNKEVQGKPVLTRIDKNIDFNWRRESPAPGIVNLDKWSVRWTGKLIAPGTGVYEIGVNADNGVRIYVNDKLIVDAWSTAAPDRLKSGFIELVKGRKYKLRIEFFENIGDAMAKLGLALRYDPKTEIKKAAEVAQKSDIAIICAGLNKSLEGESYDREKLTLPDDQVSLIKAVTAVNKNTIVVLYNATPILMNEWIDRVPAIIEAFYPGQEGSAALADILFGDINPSGKLPLTFIKSWEDSPAFGTYPGAKEIANYTEGIYVGYRHFDKNEIEPLFPFGYGLSYTTFNYSNLEITPNIIKQNGIVTVKVNIQNTGKMIGDEIVQLYVQDVESSVEREVKALKGFKRVSLKPNESNIVTFELDKSSLAFYDVKKKQWTAEPGKFKVMVGSSSRDIRLENDFELR